MDEAERVVGIGCVGLDGERLFEAADGTFGIGSGVADPFVVERVTLQELEID